MKLFISFLFIFLMTSVKAADNLILITLDGVRWQEIFTGIDEQLMNSATFSKKSNLLKTKFWSTDVKERQTKLVPFISQHIKKNGSLIGDRRQGSKMSVANIWQFSYPGYSEIMTGIVDPNIDSNKKFNNPQVSFLEWLNNKDGYDNKLAAFGSWDVFPYIFNVQRSKLQVNAGYEPASGYALSAEIQILNQVQKELPGLWHNVRYDSFTFRFAKDYLLKVQPKVLVIAFGETDDFAHDGKYDEYILSLHRTDDMISELWQLIQKIEQYKNNTDLIITTDHGRGSALTDWQHHASKKATNGYLKDLKDFKEGIIGSENTWIAAIGPDIKNAGLVTTKKEVHQQQVAATILILLDEPVEKFNAKIGKPINAILNNP